MEREVQRQTVEQAGITEETAVDAMQTSTASDFPPGVKINLDARTVLSIATDYSRELQNRRDDLYRAGLSLFGARRDFGFEVSGALEYIFSGSDVFEDQERGSASASIERILPTGGRLRISGNQDFRQELINEIETERYAGQGEIRLDQPLLAGAGYRASHDALTQAERDYVYALRDFTLERQDFAIETLRQYYGLLGQRKVVENTETNYQQFVYLRQRSEALFKVNRAPAIDVLRSQQEELSAFNRLTTTRESYQIQVGRFLVLLGLPSSLVAELADDIPELREVGISELQAVELAISRRPDLQTVRDRLADAKRRLKVARNLARPELNLFGSSAWTASDAESIGDQEYQNDWQVGMRAEIPFDQRDERDAVKSAEISLLAAERRLAEQEDTTRLEVRESYSRLRSLTVSVEIQIKNIEIAQRRAENALLQFRNGTLSNRDVVEAANDLLDARNSYISALSDYEIQRLTLLRQIGLLDVSREGAIIELTPDV